jgi:chorismate mutase
MRTSLRIIGPALILVSVPDSKESEMNDDNRDIPADLVELRHSIDNLDAAMVHILAERFRCTHAIGMLKAKHGLASRDSEREATQMNRLREIAAASKLDSNFIQKFYALVVQDVIRDHEAFARDNQSPSSGR